MCVCHAVSHGEVQDVAVTEKGGGGGLPPESISGIEGLTRTGSKVTANGVFLATAPPLGG